MKRIAKILQTLLVTGFVFGMMGCAQPEVHKHTFSAAWEKDETDHWHKATCGHDTEVSGKAEHKEDEASHTWNHEDYRYDSVSGKDIRKCTVKHMANPFSPVFFIHSHGGNE